MSENHFPPALPHGEIKELFKDIFFVTGTVNMPLKLPMRVSRNMVIIRQGDRLILVNSVRLDDSSLQKLDKLGKVTDVIRLAAFHGMDDPFYKHRYNATIWNVQGQSYFKGFKPSNNSKDTYFQADQTMDQLSKLPIDDATLFKFNTSRPSEGLLLLKQEGGILISGDCLQNWNKTDQYFNFIAKIMMKAMGFIKAYNIGPGWLKATHPDPKEIKSILDLNFEHVLPSHGKAVIGNAKALYRTNIESACRE